MIRTTFTAVLLVTSTVTAARGQQAPIPAPPKTVHPVPVSPTSCRGCSDGGTPAPATVKGYDEKRVDSSSRKTPPQATRAARKATHLNKVSKSKSRHKRKAATSKNR